MAGMPRIVIDQQRGSIGINITPAVMRIATPHPRMRVTREMPRMSLETKAPEFKLNWTKVRSESGLKPPAELSKYQSNQANVAVGDCIVEVVHDGNFLAEVVNPSNRVAELSRQKTLKASQTDINIGSMPQSLPEVEWDPGFINIRWSDSHFQIEWDGEYLPEIVVDPPFSVEIYLRERPYIRVLVEDGEVTHMVGKHIDRRL